MKNVSSPRTIKLGYGVAELGIIAAELLLRLHLLIFYTDVVGIPSWMAGLAIGLATLWDAVTDPLMGIISDHTKHPAGKRRPYIFWGGILLALSVLLIYNPPAMDNHWSKFFFLLFSYIVINTSMTIIAVPHAALGGEIAFDRNERTEVYGWRFLFSNLGALVGTVIPGYYLVKLEKENIALRATAYSNSAFWICCTVMVTALITYWITRKYDKPAKEKPFRLDKSLFTSWKTAISHRLFLPLMISYAIATIGLTINSAFAMYYYKYRLLLQEIDIQKIIAIFLVVICFSIAGWIIFSSKVGKKKPAFWGIFLLGIATCIAYPLFPVGKGEYPLIMSLIGGLLVGSVALLDSLVADVVDYDEWETGEHREGLFFGIWKMAAKVSRAIALSLVGFILDLIGFVPNTIQTPETSWYLALVFGPVVGFFFIVGALVFLLMPYKDEEHQEIQRLLHERNAQ